jgi:hypothetical protein
MGLWRLGLYALLALCMAGKAGSAQDEFKPLKEAARESFVRFELKPFPALRIITEPGHLKHGELARAVLYDSGREEIWLSADALRSDELWIILNHEVCHLKTWREHGAGVREHGIEFMRTCRKYALSRKACAMEH